MEGERLRKEREMREGESEMMRERSEGKTEYERERNESEEEKWSIERVNDRERANYMHEMERD